MSLQIKEILLYSLEGELRRVRFKLNAVNIITGHSRTGKSALSDIIDYCLGRSRFTIPVGVLVDYVSWYGVILDLHNGQKQIVIAKPKPKHGGESQSGALLKLGSNLKPPDFDDLELNSTDSALVALLSKEIGITPNLHIPTGRASRPPLEATIRHSTFYLYQEQSIVTNRKILFHRQDEQHIPQAIRDTIPYFLGAVGEESLAILNELNTAKEQLRTAEANLDEQQRLISGGIRRARALLSEAFQAGLAEESAVPENPGEIIGLLRSTQAWTPEQEVFPEPSIEGDLRLELERLRREFRRVDERLSAARSFQSQAQGYGRELQHHEDRLQAVKVFQNIGPLECPLCESNLEGQLPSVSSLRDALDSVSTQLELVHQNRPRLEEYILSLESDANLLRQEIRDTELTLESVVAEHEAANEIRDRNSRAARVLGRISLYLETMNYSAGDPDRLRALVEEAQVQVERLQNKMDSKETEDLLESILRRISSDMTEWAKDLDLEHSNSPYRLDLRKLTVIADSPDRPSPMERLGSAENWLGCHVIALLALHKHFRRPNDPRPVPGFLILDQPAQGYFPSAKAYESFDGTPESAQKAGGDLASVHRLFELLLSVGSKIGDFQLIITEHADLEDSRFQDALIEPRWNRNPEALVPMSWIEQNPGSPDSDEEQDTEE